MAAFRIHEDVGVAVGVMEESRKPLAAINKNKNEKKNFLDNRAKVQVFKGQKEATDQEKRALILSDEQKEVEEKKPKILEDIQLKQENKENNMLIQPKEEEPFFAASLLNNNEYRNDIWLYLREREETFTRPKPSYMTKQPELSWNSRTILIDWLISISDEFTFCDETLHLGVNYVDRFLSRIAVGKNKFQLIGAAAMRLATKLVEYQPLSVKEWSELTAETFTPKQILNSERAVLKVLKFEMNPPTIYDFIQFFSAEYDMDKITIHLAMFISELVLLEGSHYLLHTPSVIAAAAIALARKTLGESVEWPTKLQIVSGYSTKNLELLFFKLRKTLLESSRKAQSSVREKYGQPKYSEVTKYVE